jgi:hypothetical protein
MDALSSPMHPSSPQAPRLFKVACVLTLLGNGLLILVNLFKAGMLWVGAENGGVGPNAIVPLKALLGAVILSCVGAALGAAFMLGGRRLGFHIYAVANIVHLVATAGVMLLWLMTVYLSFVAFLLFFYCFIPIGFLLYFRRNSGWLR